MKKLITICVLTLLFSCSKNNNLIEIENVNQSKITQILENRNLSEQKMQYSLLNKEEKLTLWNSKLNKISNTYTLNKRQLQLINEFNNKINSSHYKYNSDEQIYLKTVVIPKYLKRLKKEFTINQIGAIFYTISYQLDPITQQRADSGLYEPGDQDGGGGTGNCNCNKNSMVSCKWLNAPSCLNKKCNEPSSTSCGFGGFYECNGICNI